MSHPCLLLFGVRAVSFLTASGNWQSLDSQVAVSGDILVDRAGEGIAGIWWVDASNNSQKVFSSQRIKEFSSLISVVSRLRNSGVL